ncbi:hypothetical protein [Methanobrevibacter arboriphilus]|nr:hypothetical protein [Methanobrevibacter arboriphilus]
MMKIIENISPNPFPQDTIKPAINVSNKPIEANLSKLSLKKY